MEKKKGRSKDSGGSHRLRQRQQDGLILQPVHVDVGVGVQGLGRWAVGKGARVCVALQWISDLGSSEALCSPNPAPYAAEHFAQAVLHP